MKRRRQGGVSFVELIVVIAIIGIVTPAVMGAYSAGLRYRAEMLAAGQEQSARIRFEDRIRGLLQGAFLSADVNDTASYFIVQQSSGAETDLGDTLVFTTLGEQPRGGFLAATDDFETLNEKDGPQGGSEEVSLSITPVGEVADQTGLFLREQRPPDGDPTQGGQEQLLNADVRSIQFECYDGQQWQPVWDTTATARRLPAAVRITYTLRQDPQTQLQFIVRLPMSDVTASNPVTQGATP